MNDLLNKLNKSVGNQKKEKAPDRPTIYVPHSILESFERYAGAQAVLEVVEARKEVEQDNLNHELLKIWTQSLYNNGTRPANPRLQTERDNAPDITGLFQVQARFKMNIKPGNDEIDQRLTESLVDAGITKRVAKEIVSQEVDTNPQTMLRPFNELVNGHYEGKQFVEATEKEQAIAAKLLNFVMNDLTEDERNTVVRKVENTKVKDGFLERLPGYVDSVSDVRNVLNVIQPVHFVSHIKFGVNDTPEEKVERLTHEAGRIIGQSL